MLSHLLVMFWTNSETVGLVFPYLQEGVSHVPEPSILDKVNQLFIQIHFSLGAYGVAIFFMISGFTINLSLENKGIRQFITKRLFRIWPTYLFGFSITFFMILIYTRLYDMVFPYGLKDWLMQCSLLRNWFWVPSIDGISWTLEIEVEFYVFAGIFYFFRRSFDQKGICFVAGIMSLFNFLTYFWLDYLLITQIKVYCLVYTISFFNINILYIMLGISAFNYYRGHWTLQQLVAMSIKLFFLLCWCVYFSFERGAIQDYTVSYLFGFLTFWVVYILNDKLSHFRILNFFDQISYPLYIVHGLNGYIISAFLLQHGINPLACFGVSVGFAVITAYLLHITVETWGLKLYNYLCNLKRRPIV